MWVQVLESAWRLYVGRIVSLVLEPVQNVVAWNILPPSRLITSYNPSLVQTLRFLIDLCCLIHGQSRIIFQQSKLIDGVGKEVLLGLLYLN